MATRSSEGNVVIPAESAEAIKQNLRAVADELTRVRDRAREEADSLDRIRGMLDLTYLNDLLSVIDSLETRVKQMEKGGEVKRWKTELHNEQVRLAKLWDAFKTQEDQLRALERERDEALKGYRTMEKDLADLGSPASIRRRFADLEAENRRLEAESTVVANRLEKYVELFTKEQERLAKLYKVYEDAEARLAKYEKGAKPAQKIKVVKVAAKPAVVAEAKLAPKQRLAYRTEMQAFKRRASVSKGGKGPYDKRPGALRIKRKYGVK
jgi:chromosome segregation ATPase